MGHELLLEDQVALVDLRQVAAGQAEHGVVVAAGGRGPRLAAGAGRAGGVGGGGGGSGGGRGSGGTGSGEGGGGAGGRTLPGSGSSSARSRTSSRTRRSLCAKRSCSSFTGPSREDCNRGARETGTGSGGLATERDQAGSEGQAPPPCQMRGFREQGLPEGPLQGSGEEAHVRALPPGQAVEGSPQGHDREEQGIAVADALDHEAGGGEQGEDLAP